MPLDSINIAVNKPKRSNAPSYRTDPLYLMKAGQKVGVLFMELLTVKELASLKNVTERAVQKSVACGKLKATKVINTQNITTFMIAIDDLEPTLQAKYYKQQTQHLPCPTCKSPEKVCKELDGFAADERGEIDFWVNLIAEWQEYREKIGVKSKAEVDDLFITYVKLQNPDISISVDILYRKWAAIREGNFEVLVDKRGKSRKGISETPEEIIQTFQSYYLQEAKHPIARCIEYTELYLREYAPYLVDLIPSYSTFRRKVEEIPYPVRVLGREGAKAYYDKCSPYIRREYESIESNDFWVADNHTFDVMVAGQDGKPHRIYLTAFMDARSGIFTGYYVTTAPSSYATLLALRKGILEYGIPRNIYVDNGREFLNFDVGGLGHRAKKTYADGKEKFEPPGVFKRLGIEMTNAIVRNARAKIIERRFRDVKDHMSRLFDTYTGGTVVERPDRLKHVMKKGNIVTDEELIQAAEIMIEGYFNHQPYNGSVIEDKGKPRIEVFKENRKIMRKADEESLNLMLQRSTRKQTVGRNGVKIQIAGKTLDFTNDELRTLMGKEVYLRYDPENLNSVRVYDLEDRFLTTAMLKTTLGYGADKDSVQEQMKIIRRAEKATKDALYYSRLPIADKKSAFELVMAAANATREESEQIVDPKIVEWVRVCEEPLLKAVGDIDLNIMTKNARLHRQNETKE